MTVNVSIVCQNSDLTQSNVHYSNIVNHFCIRWALLALKSVLHFRKILDIPENWKVFLK